MNDRARTVSTDGPRSQPRIFIIKLKAPDGNDAARKLRAFLKVALRKWDLRCIAITGEPQPEPTTTPHGAL